MLYLLLKFVHILGIVVLVGNVTITAVWKVFADRTENAATIAFAQRVVVGTDWVFTGSGIVLTMLGGYGMAAVGKIGLTTTSWLLWGQILFLVSGLLWLLILVPVQSKQLQLSRQFATDAIPLRYRKLSRIWLIWGVVATVPLIAAMFLMVTKM